MLIPAKYPVDPASLLGRGGKHNPSGYQGQLSSSNLALIVASHLSFSVDSSLELCLWNKLNTRRCCMLDLSYRLQELL